MSPFNADNSRMLGLHFSYFGLYDGSGTVHEEPDRVRQLRAALVENESRRSVFHQRQPA